MYWAQYSPQEAVNLWKLWHKQGKGKRKGKRKTPGNILTRELENVLRSHPDPKRRACDLMTHTNTVMRKNRFDRFYVGKSNFKYRKPRTKKQY